MQRRLTGDEFRSFINLMVWTVSLVSDGVFDADDAEMIIEDRAHIDTLERLGLVERGDDNENLYRFHPDYWEWQTSREELEKLAARRDADKIRKRAERSKPPSPDKYEDEAPFT